MIKVFSKEELVDVINGELKGAEIINERILMSSISKVTKEITFNFGKVGYKFEYSYLPNDESTINEVSDAVDFVIYNYMFGNKKTQKPSQLDTFIYGLMKEARRDSLFCFLENWGITEQDYEDIKTWFKDELSIKL